MSLFCRIEDLNNESDVEQKLVFPLLTYKSPIGLGYLVSDFSTKMDLRRITIGKGNSSKVYYPDYLIILQGLPVVTIEVKRPGSDLENALSEARLYSTEINALFPTSINPCHKIIVTDGCHLIARFADSNENYVELSLGEMYVENSKFTKLQEFVSKSVVLDYCINIYKRIRGNVHFTRPVGSLGGKMVQNEEVEENGFGVNLALEYKYLFNPDNSEDRINIVKNAYVHSKRREKHVEPIRKIIKSVNLPSVTNVTLIDDTDNASALVEKIRINGNQPHALLLLIGSVGSGKSTFIDYFREVGMPVDLKGNTFWISFDLNNAPLNKEEIYNWIKDKIISSFKTSVPEYDFDSYEVLSKLFHKEIKKFENGPIVLLKENIHKYNEKLAEKMFELQNDKNLLINAMIRFICKDKGKTLIIVLDNCDKRNRDDQLLMFQVAQWIRQEYECIVFLPIRDTTYDIHRKEPPLDTVIKDLVFRIDPPQLSQVIYQRVKYALNKINLRKDEVLSYYTPNNIRVEYLRSEQAIYLKCILNSLFQSDRFFRRLIYGLAGKNIRKGLEIFLDFCKSGHIPGSEILKIRQSNGEYVLPSHIVTRVLLRGNRRYFQDMNSTVRNLFFSRPEDNPPDPFLRVDILLWLSARYRVKGPNGILGYQRASELIKSLINIGHNEDYIRIEIDTLIKAECINTESQQDMFQDEDLLIITPAGHVHLDLLCNVDYLSACSEDVWYRNQEIAVRISKRISNQTGEGHLTKECTLANAEEMIDYLVEYRDLFLSYSDTFLKPEFAGTIFDFGPCKEIIGNIKHNENIYNAAILYKPGQRVQCEIVSIKDYGVFVEFDLKMPGYIHISSFPPEVFSRLKIGDVIQAKIDNYFKEHKRYRLKAIFDESN